MIMSLSDDTRHYAIHITANQLLSSIAKNLLDFLVCMNNGTDLTGAGWNDDDGAAWVFTEN